MVAPGEKSTTTTVLFPSLNLRLLSQGTGRAAEKQNLYKQDVKPPTRKVPLSENTCNLFTHGLSRLQHFSSDSPVRFIMYSEAAAALISLHADNTACLYRADGHKQTLLTCIPYMGLTATKMSGCVVGWGPGPVFTLLDSELCPLDVGRDALDIRVCQAAEHSTELVTAGVGNVCVWSVMLMRCKVKIQDGLQECVFTHMTLAPPRSDRPHRGFAVSGPVVTVVDLDGGRVLEHKKNLCSCDITAVVYCFQLDCLIIASQDFFIRVWGPDWAPRVAFSGHKDVMNSLYYSSKLNVLISSSLDCTIRCWNVEECDAHECVQTEQKNPPLYIGGTRKEDIFFSFSHQGVDFWAIRTLYTLHCKLRGSEDTLLRQIHVSHFPAPYPTRVLCVSGDNDVTLVAADTGALLTSFKAKDRILCADYCLHKEILLALTEAGTVLQANTLTNPITLMQEWEGRGQGPWQEKDHLIQSKAENLATPGPACCLVLYVYVVDAEKALEEWRDLQENRGCRRRSKALRDDTKNKFLIILGQSGGCVSALKINNGKVLCRVPAHNGQKVTTLQVYPEDSYLLSTGEDLTVVVWRVNPFVNDCLTQQLSLNCGQPQVYLGALGPQLALTFQEPNSGSYSLKHFNLLNERQTDYEPRVGHSEPFTGLCVLPDLKVFVSSSLDKTACIWNEENHLIRKLHLNAVPECLVWSGSGGELFLGIKGDLYRMSCEKFLPRSYRETLPDIYHAEPFTDLPIEDKDAYDQRKTPSVSKSEEKLSQAIWSNQILTEYMQQPKESVRTSNMDLEALLQGTVKCKKGKPPSTKQTKKEAFGRYMEIVYRLPPSVKVDLDYTFQPNKFIFSYTEPKDFRPPVPPKLKKPVSPQPEPKIEIVPVKVKKKKEKKAPPVLEDVEPQPVKKVIPKKPVVVKKEKEPPRILSPVEEPKPKTPSPPPPPPPPQPPRPRLRTPTPPPPREPSPEVPAFLKQFAEMEWFRDVYPDKQSIPSTLSPQDFFLKLLSFLQTCSVPSKIKIIVAMQALYNQGLLQCTDQLYQSLIDSVHKFAKAQMSPVERTVLTEILNLLLRLKPAGFDLVKTLLILLAYKKTGLREVVLRVLKSLGVDEAEQWLWPELESWDTEVKDQSDMWKSLRDRAACWLELWISKFKEHNRHLYLLSTEKWKPSIVSAVDVLNHFCFVQKEKHRKARCAAPAGRKNTVLLPLYDCSSQPILRLGETYSMARIRRPPGIILPPIRNRPFLMHFPSFITLPLPRVTLFPFHTCSDEDWLKASTRRYFIHQESLVEYYR